MHFEILVEDASGKIALESILDKILGKNGQDHTYKIISYKSIGRIPKNLKGTTDPQKRILLDRLPNLLRGYGRSLRGIPAVVVLVVDLDDKDCLVFKQEMVDILNDCNPQPTTLFRIAIEEGEAWLLGDRNAVKVAYPRAKEQILSTYVQDSICGTWEKLADALYPGGSQELKRLGWPHTGQTKCEWAKNIAPHLDVENNQSRSFQVFRDGIRNLM
ncbi:MAG: DUF4276 family protein [Proteobacteria bacterium]|jgi:hypothetical protein|nr:DUF4276 family protein [Pseudomonadota bacterium]MCG2743892.1 DUF4276 family protein [Desulfobacteraceae bacterium]MBU3984489.1 DUF4276 family protein [Pseudomonadota bacterium]MBU4029016.1 DUF4276 family protein [Pseudomonadota bacterium]MBU4043071.1 DUF4276 family protein [Pseudomonadota bacterium]